MRNTIGLRIILGVLGSLLFLFSGSVFTVSAANQKKEPIEIIIYRHPQ